MDGYTKQEMMRRFGLTVVFMLTGVLTMASVAWAGNHETCEDGSIGACMEDMLSNQLMMIDEVEGMILDMSNMGLFSLGRSQSGVGIQVELLTELTKLKKESRRASAANEAISDDEYNQFLDQGDTNKGEQCQLSDINYYNSLEDENFLPPGLMSTGVKFGNNKCDVFTAMDEDGNNIKVNERKENMCETSCEEKTNPGNGQSRRGESKGRFNESLLDSIDSAKTATQTIATQRIHIQQLGVLLSGLERSGGVSLLTSHTIGCTPPDTGPSGDLIAASVLQGIVILMDVTIASAEAFKVGSKGTKDVAEGVFELDVAGFNGTIVKIIPSSVFTIANGISAVLNHLRNVTLHGKGELELVAKIIRAGQDDNADTCREKLKEDTEALKLSAGNTEAALADIQAEMALLRSQVQENRALLLTPQGKRTDFPAR